MATQVMPRPMPEKPLRDPSKPRLKRTQLRKVSVKRLNESLIYAKKRREFLELNPICCFPEICPEWSSDVHHKAGRSGANFLDERTWLACCANHHRWIEDHKRQARGMGLITYGLGIKEA